MKRVMIVLVLVVLLIGVVGAIRTITPVDGVIHIDDFVAGSEVQANFSFIYFDHKPYNVDDSPLIMRINITSNDSVNYPVWKNDFEIGGYIERYMPWYSFPFTHSYDEVIDLTCSEDSPLTISHSFGSNVIEDVPNGTFYCYNASKNLKLDEGDSVFLNIKSNPALWPGT